MPVDGELSPVRFGMAIARSGRIHPSGQGAKCLPVVDNGSSAFGWRPARSDIRLVGQVARSFARDERQTDGSRPAIMRGGGSTEGGEGA